MVLGPQPPARAVAWGEPIGPTHVLAVLDGARGRVPRGALPAGAALRAGRARSGERDRLRCAHDVAPARGRSWWPPPSCSALRPGRDGGRSRAARCQLPGDASAAGVDADRRDVDRRRPSRRRSRSGWRAGSARGLSARRATTSCSRGRARAFAGALRRASPAGLRPARRAARRAPDHACLRPTTRSTSSAATAGAIAWSSPRTPSRRDRREPLIALVDATLDRTHPEFAAGQRDHDRRASRSTNSHGTATASVAAAPQNGVGITGVWPGARALNVGLDNNISCAPRPGRSTATA